MCEHRESCAALSVTLDHTDLSAAAAAAASLSLSCWARRASASRCCSSSSAFILASSSCCRFSSSWRDQQAVGTQATEGQRDGTNWLRPNLFLAGLLFQLLFLLQLLLTLGRLLGLLLGQTLQAELQGEHLSQGYQGARSTRGTLAQNYTRAPLFSTV